MRSKEIVKDDICLCDGAVARMAASSTNDAPDVNSRHAIEGAGLSCTKPFTVTMT